MTKGLLERLADGEVVVGDGSFVFTLERRGYVVAGAWTPEACVLHPEAATSSLSQFNRGGELSYVPSVCANEGKRTVPIGATSSLSQFNRGGELSFPSVCANEGKRTVPVGVRQLHREYLRAGADVMQTATFYSSDKQLQYVATFHNNNQMKELTTTAINNAAVDLAKSVAKEGGALVAGSVSPVTATYFKEGKEYAQVEFRKQIAVFKEKGVDFVLGEFFVNIEEAEWAIEIMAEVGVPVACTMRIPYTGDTAGISPQECAVRMAKAGADVVGVNCMYDPTNCLKTIALMKEGLKEAGLQTYLMVQPLGYHTQDPGSAEDLRGYNALQEMPFAMEPRALTRIDAHRFAREAYELGVRYIGGCCGFEPHHIRAISEELAKERGRHPPCASNMSSWECLQISNVKSNHRKASWEYWDQLTPGAGRPINMFSTLSPKE